MADQQQQPPSRRVFVKSGPGVRSKELHELVADHLHTYIWLREGYDPYRPNQKKTGKPCTEMSAYITFIMESEVHPVFDFEGNVDPRTKVNKIFIDKYMRALKNDRLMQSIRQQGRPPLPPSTYMHEFPPPFTPVHQSSRVTPNRDAIMSWYRRRDVAATTAAMANDPTEHTPIITPSGAAALPAEATRWGGSTNEAASGAPQATPVQSQEQVAAVDFSTRKMPPRNSEALDDFGVLQIKYQAAQRRIAELEAQLAAVSTPPGAAAMPDHQDVDPISDPQEPDANLESLLFEEAVAKATEPGGTKPQQTHGLPSEMWEGIEDNLRAGKRGKTEEYDAEVQNDDRKPAATNVSLLDDMDNYDLSPLTFPSPLYTPGESTP